MGQRVQAWINNARTVPRVAAPSDCPSNTTAKNVVLGLGEMVTCLQLYLYRALKALSTSHPRVI